MQTVDSWQSVHFYPTAPQNDVLLKSKAIHPNFMTYNQDFVEARAEDIFEDWVKSFFVDLTPLDESALYALALDTAIEEAL